MDSAKIRLSVAELELVSDPTWILTKNEIIRKANFLLGELLDLQKEHVRKKTKILPEEVISIPGKISKGENYLGLPYLILDHPRVFQRSGIFAIRTMFWWGKFFSITLHLSNGYKDIFADKIIRSYHALQNYFICINENEWQHHFDTTNYIPISSISAERFMTQVHEKSFLKIAKARPLQQWDDAAQLLFNDFVDLLERLED